MSDQAHSRRHVVRRWIPGAWSTAATFLVLATACSDTAPVAPTDDAPALAARSVRASGAATCDADAQLIGSIELSTVDAPTTWWGLTKAGLQASGMDSDAEYQAAIEGYFHRAFPSLDNAVAYLVDDVRFLDTNADNHLCAYGVRGTRPRLSASNNALYSFWVHEDR
jgi:hypothetical protein